MGVRLAELIAALDAAYPPRLAEAWDTGIGLTCGDPLAEVHRVLLAVDGDLSTVREAERVDAQLLLTHHPLLFRPVQSVAASTDKGALVHRLIRGGIAHFAAHTNADRAVGGVNDALADTLGILDTVPLVPPSAATGFPIDAREGLGRVGHLPGPMTLSSFAARVAAALPATISGVRVAGDPERIVTTVAVCGGAGGSELTAATTAGADVYVTSDLTHHTVAEHVADRARPAVVEVSHWSGEWPWLGRAAAVIADAFGGAVATTVSTLRTDAWTFHVTLSAGSRA